MHKQPVLNNMGLFNDENYDGAEYLYEKGFYIPSGLGITEEQMEVVAEKLKKVFFVGE